MNKYPTYTPKYDEDNYWLWADQDGIGFVLKVLWELGYPEEPYETLEKIIENVHKKTGVVITSLENAHCLYEEEQDFKRQDHKILVECRQKRIDARNRTIQL